MHGLRGWSLHAVDVMWVQDEELIQFFYEAAAEAPELKDAIEAVRLVRDKATNVGKGIAFVLFKTKASATLRVFQGSSGCMLMIGRDYVMAGVLNCCLPLAEVSAYRRSLGCAKRQ